MNFSQISPETISLVERLSDEGRTVEEIQLRTALTRIAIGKIESGVLQAARARKQSELASHAGRVEALAFVGQVEREAEARRNGQPIVKRKWRDNLVASIHRRNYFRGSILFDDVLRAHGMPILDLAMR